MIDREQLVLLICAGAVLATFYFSRLCLRNLPRFSGEQLETISPEYKSINTKYNAIEFGVGLIYLSISLVVAMIFHIKSNDIRIVFLGLPFLSFLTIFEGLFGLSTNLYPMTTRYRSNVFVHDRDRKLHWVAVLQMALGIFEVIIGYLLFFLY